MNIAAVSAQDQPWSDGRVGEWGKGGGWFCVFAYYYFVCSLLFLFLQFFSTPSAPPNGETLVSPRANAGEIMKFTLEINLHMKIQLLLKTKNTNTMKMVFNNVPIFQW